MQTVSDVKLYGCLPKVYLLSCNKRQRCHICSPTGVRGRLLSHMSLENCSTIETILPDNSTLQCRSQSVPSCKVPINPLEYHLFRFTVGGLACLTPCTRPDLMFSVSALSRSIRFCKTGDGIRGLSHGVQVQSNGFTVSIFQNCKCYTILFVPQQSCFYLFFSRTIPMTWTCDPISGFTDSWSFKTSHFAVKHICSVGTGT